VPEKTSVASGIVTSRTSLLLYLWTVVSLVHHDDVIDEDGDRPKVELVVESNGERRRVGIGTVCGTTVSYLLSAVSLALVGLLSTVGFGYTVNECSL
jgi:Fe-S oxidoreductase